LGTIYTSDSTDIVAHEMGHALLDAQRPDFWSVQALEIWAFHEAYADITAIVNVMQHKKVLKAAIEETNSDLRKTNVISEIAEQLGGAVHFITKGKGGYNPNFLRNAVNDFKYKNPSQLPKKAPHNRLCAECHSFGRIFLGAWYDILVTFYEYNLKKGYGKVNALKMACDEAFSYLLEALRRAPRVVRFHEAVCKTMLSVAKQNSQHVAIMRKIFRERRLIPTEVILLATDRGDFNDEIQHNGMFMHLSRPTTIKLSDYMDTDVVHAFAVDELADFELEVADDVYYEFDTDGKVTYEISSTQEELVETARLCVATIQSEVQFGQEEDTMWEAKGNKLHRTYIE
jgi:hypothetical protein